MTYEQHQQALQTFSSASFTSLYKIHVDNAHSPVSVLNVVETFMFFYFLSCNNLLLLEYFSHGTIHTLLHTSCSVALSSASTLSSNRSVTEKNPIEKPHVL